MVIYIISLPDERGEKRLEILKKQIKLAKLDKFPIKILGIDGRATIGKDLKPFFGKKFLEGHLRHRSGTRGCALSHVKVCLNILRNNINENILVLEDDVIINKDFLNLLPEKLPEDFHVIFLHEYDQKSYEDQDDTKTSIRKLNKNINNFLAQGCCYIINGKKIKEILNAILPLEAAFDVALAKEAPSINRYILDPSLKISSLGKTGDSYRRDLDAQNLNLYIKFYKIPPRINDDTVFRVLVDTTMTREYSHFISSFHFYAIDYNNKYICLDDYLDLKFVADADTFSQHHKDEIHFKFKPSILKPLQDQHAYKLNVQFNYFSKFAEDKMDIIYNKK